jgi:mycothiol synthase
VPPAPAPIVQVDVTSLLEPQVRDEVRTLLDDAERTDGFPGLSDQAQLHLEDGATSDVISLLARLGDPGELAGYATLSPDSEAGGGGPGGEADAGADGGPGGGAGTHSAWTIETVVRPERRDDAADVLGALLDTALGEVGTRGGGTVRAWLRADPVRGAEKMAARGLQPSRELLQLRAPLPSDAVRDASSPPIPVRPFRPGRDEQAWLAVNARAFASHPEQGRWTLDDLVRREREPWFDPGGFLLHEVGGRLAGFCWTKIHLNPVLGEIYVIGIDPDFQGRGLGRALTRAGLGHLASRAVPTAMLYVESTNTPALVLYRSLGFTEHHREVQFSAAVPARAQGEAPTARPTP